jgi:hypothetical protein
MGDPTKTPAEVVGTFLHAFERTDFERVNVR